MTKRSLRDSLSTDSCVNILLQELDVMDKEIRRFGRILRGNLSEANISNTNAQAKTQKRRSHDIISGNQCQKWLDSVEIAPNNPGDFNPDALQDFLLSESFLNDVFLMEAEKADFTVNTSSDDQLVRGCDSQLPLDFTKKYASLESIVRHDYINQDKSPDYDVDSASDASSEIMQSSPCSPTTLAQTITKQEDEDEQRYGAIRKKKSKSNYDNNFDELYNEKTRIEKIVSEKSIPREYNQEGYRVES